ncbi:DEAD/DEAH box helicase [Alicyclobacillus herbarius]|uniref:DEAD/DEAH box helicase n=1 Tax=Alicyclobacillus herbarius TaxID=122960 RepID=UPI0003FF0067|nr:DEAD/DEAH box helicase [Alicyclobacillus herbarius]
MEADETVEDSHHITASGWAHKTVDIRRWQNEHGGVPLNGAFLAADPWTKLGTGVLWLVEGETKWLRELASTLGVQYQTGDSPVGPGVALVIPGHEFVDVLNRHTWEGVLIGPELALHLNLLRLAQRLVQEADVLPFAALADWTWRQVLAEPLDVQSGDGLSVRQGSPSGQYSSIFIPAWRMGPGAALFRSILHQGYELPGCEGNDTSLAAWMWVCTDWLVRQDLVELPHAPESSNLPFQIRYRGEAELVDNWQQSLSEQHPEAQKRVFIADRWLVGRMLAMELRDSGWSESLFDKTGSVDWQLAFELIPPKQGMDGHWTFRGMVVHRWFPWRAPLMEWWRQTDRRWRIGEDVLTDPDVWLLPRLAKAAEVCPAIARMLSNPAPGEVVVEPREVMELINEQIPNLLQAGFPVLTPDLEHLDTKDVRIRVRVKRTRRRSRPAARANAVNAWFDLEQLVEFDWSVVVDDAEVSKEQFESLVREQQPYVYAGGTWKRIPVEAIVERIRALTDGAPASMSVWELVRSVLQNEQADLPLEVSFDPDAAPVRDFVEALAQVRVPKPWPLPRGFRGQLRDYQKQGFFWLLQLRDLGLGACLADDMGLGKTIQVLAYFLSVKEQGQARGPHLLVCPTSLVPNWRAEIQRFAPALRVYVHHGAKRHETDERGQTRLAREGIKADVVLTTFATCVRDVDELSQVDWDAVVVDEAQNIKNVDTKQAAAVRQLSARHRIALTGTPVENRLEELWAIMDFLNPGYLGGQTWFRRHFAAPITAHPQGPTARHLAQLLTPVLLRRRKVDPSIQAELPDKWEVRDTAGLKTEQAALYQSIVNELWVRLPEAVSNMSRRGRILTALTRLKQVCDHPALITGGSTDPERSGKLSLLLDLIEEVVDQGEAGLVFTQFREMGEIICDALAAKFGWRPGFLHGGLRPAERGELVERFQTKSHAAPILVLSLKAGGVGLNLTRANHVFHFDRWWNPAVEDQATDRAFRIGQTRDVQVHKLVCSGTLEERIDELIAAKRQLSAAVVEGAEGWITELDDAQLRALFALDVESALGEEE